MVDVHAEGQAVAADKKADRGVGEGERLIHLRGFCGPLTTGKATAIRAKIGRHVILVSAA